MLLGVKRSSSKTTGQISSGDVEGSLWLLERLCIGGFGGRRRGQPKVRGAGQMVKLCPKLRRPGWFQGGTQGNTCYGCDGLRCLLWSSLGEMSGRRSCPQLREEGHLKVRHHPRPGTLEKEKHEPWALQYEDAGGTGGTVQPSKKKEEVEPGREVSGKPREQRVSGRRAS